MRRICTVFFKDVAVISAKRSPFGSFMGSLSKFNATTLGAHAVQAAVSDINLLADQVQAVVQGVSLLAGVGTCPARQIALACGLSPTVVCTTVTQGCASGMQAIVLAANQVSTGYVGCAVAGGFESMSSTPFIQMNLRGGQLLGHSSTLDALLQDGLNCPINGVPLGTVAEKTISEFGITKYDQESFAEDSYLRTSAAWNRNFFVNEISPLIIFHEEKDNRLLSTDEEHRKVDYTKLKHLKPLYEPTGTITALTSASINDGAASVVLASGQCAKDINKKPIAYIRATAHVSTDASNFSLAPSHAIEQILKATGLTKDQVNLWEICETFASIPLITISLLGLDRKLVNVNGGALSLGHPQGATGARQVVTLIHSLKERELKRGVAVACSAGGEGVAVLVEL